MLIVHRSTHQLLCLGEPQMVEYTEKFHLVCWNRKEVNNSTVNSQHSSPHHLILDRFCSRSCWISFLSLLWISSGSIVFCAVKKAMKVTNSFFSNFDLLSSKVLSYKIYKILVIRTMDGFRTHFKEGPFIFGVALTYI